MAGSLVEEDSLVQDSLVQLESIQRRVMRMTKELVNMPCSDRLKAQSISLKDFTDCLTMVDTYLHEKQVWYQKSLYSGSQRK